jgi:hypothetical protein
MISRSKLPQLFEALGNTVGVPTVIQPILDCFEFVLIDLNSVTENILRFYIFPMDADIKSNYNELLMHTYPFVESEATNYHENAPCYTRLLHCMGFLVNQHTNSVEYYKHYNHDTRDGLLHNTRFNTQGQWQDHYTERFHNQVTLADLAYFGINGVEPDPTRHTWVERCEPGQDRKYLTIQQRRSTACH